MTILNKIIQNKKKEVALVKKREPLDLLKKKLSKTVFLPRGLKKTGRFILIAEIKLKSPSAGYIRKKVDAAKLAKQFQKNKASAVSILTDKKYFGGALENLSKARKAVKLPLLRKDFIIDEYQLYESRLHGADLVLLIASVLKSKLGSFVKLALRLKLQPLIEVRNIKELKIALKSIKPSKSIIIGINNRDLKTFKVDIKTSLNMVKLVPKGFIRISESGIFKISQLEQLYRAGFDGVLIGEGLAKNPGLFDYFV
jgi:indole-3-glycerol phosphate synthase